MEVERNTLKPTLTGSVKRRTAKTRRQREEMALTSPLVRNLVAALRADEQLQAAVSLTRKLALQEKKRLRPSATAPGWLRHMGPKATQNSHSAERQPYCLCPGCGREMESTLLYCPECTMRAARYIQVPAFVRRRQSPQSLIWLLSQAVSCR